eukprot:scaffold188702_cov82-Attheya_sp.AAC.1
MGGNGSGGKRGGAGRLAHQPGQMTLDGGLYDAQATRERRQQAPVTVAEARRREQEETERQQQEIETAANKRQ